MTDESPPEFAYDYERMSEDDRQELKAELLSDKSPYEKDLYRSFRKIIIGQREHARLVLDHLQCRSDLLEHVPSEEHAILLCVAMDLEVCNGGIKQWFTNTTGLFWEETIDVLDSIGAKEVAAVLRNAASEFPNGRPHDVLEKRFDQYKSMSESQWDRFVDYDDEYWPLRNGLYEILHDLDSMKSQDDTPSSEGDSDEPTTNEPGIP